MQEKLERIARKMVSLDSWNDHQHERNFMAISRAK